MTNQHAYRNRLIALTTALLASCASVTPPPPLAESAPAEPAAPVAAAVTPAVEPNYPKQELTRELLFGMLLGEVAVAKGDKQLASDSWLEIARRSRDVRAAERALQVSFAAGRVPQAVQAARLWQELDPGSLTPRQHLLHIFSSTGMVAEAGQELGNWMRDRPSDAAGVFLRMHTLWQPQADRQAILALTQQLAAGFPELPEAALAIALAAVDAKNNLTAVAAIDEALKRRPGWEQAILYRANLIGQQSPEAGIAYLQQAVKAQPKSRELRAALARELSDGKQLPAAAKLYAELSSEYPAEVEYLLGQALTALQLRRYAEAEAPLDKALALGVNKPGLVHFYLGTIAEEQGLLEKARTHYVSARDSEQAAQANLRLARIEAKLGNRDAALATLQLLPDASKNDQITRVQLEAQIWRELKEPERAKSALDAGLLAHADNPDLLYDRSLIFDLMGDVAAAESDLRRYLTLKPDNPAGLNALGYTLANRTQRYDEAEALLKKALEQDPDNPVIIDSMGWLQYRRGNVKEAVIWLARAFAAQPDPEIAAHYGEALWQAGRRSEARKIWAEGKKLDPAHQVLAETVQRLTGN
ncbi:tetratricopeptide repeat protein [Chitinimonas prasina]|nr:tetratricopeptide repeat protein [Chitinimonas prasina]